MDTLTNILTIFTSVSWIIVLTATIWWHRKIIKKKYGLLPNMLGVSQREVILSLGEINPVLATWDLPIDETLEWIDWTNGIGYFTSEHRFLKEGNIIATKYGNVSVIFMHIRKAQTHTTADQVTITKFHAETIIIRQIEGEINVKSEGIGKIFDRYL